MGFWALGFGVWVEAACSKERKRQAQRPGSEGLSLGHPRTCLQPLLPRPGPRGAPDPREAMRGFALYSWLRAAEELVERGGGEGRMRITGLQADDSGGVQGRSGCEGGIALVSYPPHHR